MDIDLYNAAIEGNVDVLRQNQHKLVDQITPTNNTVLHLASQCGQAQCAQEILSMHPSLFLWKNSRDETALHLAAREGHSTVVRALLDHAKALDPELESGVIGLAKEVLRTVNVENDTALHEAVRYHHLDVVQMTTQEDPEYVYGANRVGETPLYLAADGGYDDLVSVILENCTSPDYSGPHGRTALHAAVNNRECTRKLLDWKQSLIKETDKNGQTPLHYAARFGYDGAIEVILQLDKSVAYIADKDEKKTALHMAASEGHFIAIRTLLSLSPDSYDMVDYKGRNMLHIAVEQDQREAVEFILENVH